MNIRRVLVLMLKSDLVVATAALLLVSLLGATFWLLVNWTIYNKRYDISLLEYLQIFF